MKYVHMKGCEFVIDDPHCVQNKNIPPVDETYEPWEFPVGNDQMTAKSLLPHIHTVHNT